MPIGFLDNGFLVAGAARLARMPGIAYDCKLSADQATRL